MRPTPPNHFRVTRENVHRLKLPPALVSDDSYGNAGMFMVPAPGTMLKVIACDEGGWEHVSVSTRVRCPTWDEMCFVKNLFWAEDEVVIQYHPAKNDYVNQHPYCLHLWKPVGILFPTPPRDYVGK